MRRNILFLLTLLILAGCSSPAATRIFATETKPAVTVPAPTVEPTKTPEPSPTPDMRFVELLPETLEKCLEQNVLRHNFLEQDLKLLLEKEKQIITKPETIEQFSIEIPEIDNIKYKLPYFITLISKNGLTKNIISCSYIQMRDNENIIVYGTTLKRPGSDLIEIIHFAFSQKSTNEFDKQINYKPEFNDSEVFQKFRKGDYKEMGIHLILWRGYAEQGGIWEDLLKLLPENESEWLWKIWAFITPNGCAINPAKRVMECVPSQEELVKYMENKILPALSIGVIY